MTALDDGAAHASLLARPLGIDTYQEPVVYMRADCAVCRAEGFEARSRVQIAAGGRSLIATLNVVHGELIASGEVGLSTVAWRLLGASSPIPVALSHPDPVESFGHVRAKLYGHALGDAALHAIVRDVAASRYTDVQLSAFLASCVGERMNDREILGLTRAMVDVGERMRWSHDRVFDKHCIGGLPGNRTTPIVVAIAAASGLVMPKTSSRAITSPSGTADAMETLTRVDLSLDEMRRVVEREGGCLVWGGAVALSPADDVLIRVERALDVDSEAQLVASVLSKKVAAGATHAVIDVPVGPTAKVRDAATAARLERVLVATGRELDLFVRVVVSDGSQPVGRGIGPALEARDVLAVLRGEPNAPRDLRVRAARLAGEVLMLAGGSKAEAATIAALALLDDGRAWRKFEAICEAQGGLRTPKTAPHRAEVTAARPGSVTGIDNRRLAKAAKLAGAPRAAAAGIELHVRLGDSVTRGMPVLTLHAEARGELDYAMAYLRAHTDVVDIGERA